MVKYCCSNCFIDIEIKSFINSNSFKIGTCDFCSTEDIELVETSELEDLFFGLLEIYEPHDNSDQDLISLINNDWQIFRSNIDVKLLLTCILSNTTLNQLLLEKGVNYTIENKSHELLSKWDKFKDEIKYKNRFFPENFMNDQDLEIIDRFIMEDSFSIGKRLYRARISSEEGYKIDEIGKPPKEYTSDGRANPKGIPYLYLADSIETAMFETRVSYLDYVTIGKFKITEHLKLANLNTNNKPSPFLPDLDIKSYMAYKPFIERLKSELSKPMRRFDNILDYLPTQYLCEYFKKEYDGIVYGSSLNQGGTNIVLFDESKVMCEQTYIYEVNNMNLEYNLIKKK